MARMPATWVEKREFEAGPESSVDGVDHYRFTYRHEQAAPPDEASVSVYDHAASIGNLGQVNYAAAKGALNAATKAWSLRTGASRSTRSHPELLRPA